LAIDLTLGNVSAGGTGVSAQSNGLGDVDITTIAGSSVSSSTSDGIDAFALDGGNVFINLLDGSVSANTSSASFPIGPTAPLVVSGSATQLGPDPVGVHAMAVGGGTVTINQNSFVTNNGPGDGILSQSVDGANTVNVNADVTTKLGTAVAVVSSGKGTATIDVFKEGSGVGGQTQNNVTITTTGGSGLFASNSSTGTAKVSASVLTASGGPGNLTVNVTGANSGSVGVGASVASQNIGSLADVDLRNAASGSSISVEGAGDNVGIEALATTTNAVTGLGGATVAEGGGLTV
jgi:hypothetical protein